MILGIFGGSRWLSAFILQPDRSSGDYNDDKTISDFLPTRELAATSAQISVVQFYISLSSSFQRPRSHHSFICAREVANLVEKKEKLINGLKDNSEADSFLLALDTIKYISKTPTQVPFHQLFQ